MPDKTKPTGATGGLGGAREPSVLYTPSAAARQIPIFAAGRLVGAVRGDTFHKTARASRHMLRRPRAWALDVQSLADAEVAGATRVEIYDTETGTKYHAAIATIRARGFLLERGHGRQVALPLDAWHLSRPGEPAAVQMALVGLEGRAW